MSAELITTNTTIGDMLDRISILHLKLNNTDSIEHAEKYSVISEEYDRLIHDIVNWIKKTNHEDFIIRDVEPKELNSDELNSVDNTNNLLGEIVTRYSHLYFALLTINELIWNTENLLRTPGLSDEERAAAAYLNALYNDNRFTIKRDINQKYHGKTVEQKTHARLN